MTSRKNNLCRTVFVCCFRKKRHITTEKYKWRSVVITRQNIDTVLHIPNRQVHIPNPQVHIPNRQVHIPNRQVYIPNRQVHIPNRQVYPYAGFAVI